MRATRALDSGESWTFLSRVAAFTTLDRFDGPTFTA
jgi:hypothetical protein